MRAIAIIVAVLIVGGVVWNLVEGTTEPDVTTLEVEEAEEAVALQPNTVSPTADGVGVGRYQRALFGLGRFAVVAIGQVDLASGGRRPVVQIVLGHAAAR
ncbi:MAG: hypothetical protein ACU0CO_16200, partial [Shimia sp.]